MLCATGGDTYLRTTSRRKHARPLPRATMLKTPKELKDVPVDITLMTSAALIAESGGRILSVNEELCKMLKWKAENLVGQNVGILVSPRLVAKSTHDQYVRGFQSNKKSNLIGTYGRSPPAR